MEKGAILFGGKKLIEVAGFTPPSFYPVVGAVIFGYVAYKAWDAYDRHKERIAEEQKSKALKEFFTKFRVEWDKRADDYLSRKDKTYNARLKNDADEEEHCLVVAGELDRQMFNHMTAGKLNNVLQGPLHIIARHYSQFGSHIHSSYLPELSQRAINLLMECENARTPSAIAQAYRRLRDYLETGDAVVDGIVIDELQFMAFHFIRESMTKKNFIGFLVDDRGRISYHFKIGQKVLRVILSKELYNQLENDENPPRPIMKQFREMISAYFIDPKDVEGKLRQS